MDKKYRKQKGGCMKVLVTGAKGMLGQDLCPVLEDKGYEVIETGRADLDVTNSEQVNAYLDKTLPAFVIHCAAYTAVDKAEEEQNKAALVNAYGTENIAKYCGKYEIPLIYISTDYVFDGKKKTPYEPDDKTNPINTYGLSKLKGEEAVKKYCQKFYIVRTSWLYGHYGDNFVEKILTAAKNNKRNKAADDQIGSPTWTMDLAEGILKLLDKPYGIYHVCGGGEVSRYEFVNEILKQSAITADVEPCKTKDFHSLAQRPLYSAMNNARILRNWKSALKDYLELRMGEEL